ncbi:unnamed protein product [Heterobilharzia americana]|nr:unnamed protein product [Heterobilharzia americana]
MDHFLKYNSCIYLISKTLAGLNCLEMMTVMNQPDLKYFSLLEILNYYPHKNDTNTRVTMKVIKG